MSLSFDLSQKHKLRVVASPDDKLIIIVLIKPLKNVQKPVKSKRIPNTNQNNPPP